MYGGVFGGVSQLSPITPLVSSSVHDRKACNCLLQTQSRYELLLSTRIAVENS